MAKKGIRYCVFGVLNEETNAYTGGKYLSPVVQFNGSTNANDAKDYGDDRTVETDKSVTGGTLTVELNNDDDDIYVMLLGHTKSDSGEIVHNVDDVPPYVGVGAIGSISGGKWVAKFYKKVQFGEPADDNSTKEETTTFNHVTLEGDILIPEDGDWKLREVFDTFEAAKKYLNGLVGITDTAATE